MVMMGFIPAKGLGVAGFCPFPTLPKPKVQIKSVMIKRINPKRGKGVRTTWRCLTAPLARQYWSCFHTAWFWIPHHRVVQPTRPHHRVVQPMLQQRRNEKWHRPVSDKQLLSSSGNRKGHNQDCPGDCLVNSLVRGIRMSLASGLRLFSSSERKERVDG